MDKRVSIGTLAALVTLGVFAPGTACAQQAASETRDGRFGIAPFLGVYFNNAYAGGSAWGHPGVIGGATVSLALSDRARATGSFAYAEVNDVGRVGSESDYFVYGTDHRFATLGAEFTALPGTTSVSVGAEIGAVWDVREKEGQVGTPPDFVEREFTFGEASAPRIAVAPGAILRHRVSDRIAIQLGVRDYILVDNPPVSHNPALTAGLSFRIP